MSFHNGKHHVPRCDVSPTEVQRRGIPHADGSMFSDGSGYSEGSTAQAEAPDILSEASKPTVPTQLSEA